MKVNYRGYKIKAKQKGMGGYKSVYLSVARLSDNHLIEDSRNDSGETIYEVVEGAKRRIDLIEDYRAKKGLEKKLR